MNSCASCHATLDRTVHTYWGHDLCPACCIDVARLLDEHDRWPTIPAEQVPDTPADIEQRDRR